MHCLLFWWIVTVQVPVLSFTEWEPDDQTDHTAADNGHRDLPVPGQPQFLSEGASGAPIDYPHPYQKILQIKPQGVVNLDNPRWLANENTFSVDGSNQTGFERNTGDNSSSGHNGSAETHGDVSNNHSIPSRHPGVLLRMTNPARQSLFRLSVLLNVKDAVQNDTGINGAQNMPQKTALSLVKLQIFWRKATNTKLHRTNGTDKNLHNKPSLFKVYESVAPLRSQSQAFFEKLISYTFPPKTLLPDRTTSQRKKAFTFSTHSLFNCSHSSKRVRTAQFPQQPKWTSRIQPLRESRKRRKRGSPFPPHTTHSSDDVVLGAGRGIRGREAVDHSLPPHHHHHRPRRAAENVLSEVLGMNDRLNDIIDDFIGIDPDLRPRDRRNLGNDDKADDKRRKLMLETIERESLEGKKAARKSLEGLQTATKSVQGQRTAPQERVEGKAPRGSLQGVETARQTLGGQRWAAGSLEGPRTALQNLEDKEQNVKGQRIARENLERQLKSLGGLRLSLGRHRKAHPRLQGPRSALQILWGHRKARPSLGGHKMARQSLGGHKMARQSLGGHKMVRQSLGGHKMARQSLGGHKMARQSSERRRKALQNKAWQRFVQKILKTPRILQKSLKEQNTAPQQPKSPASLSTLDDKRLQHTTLSLDDLGDGLMSNSSGKVWRNLVDRSPALNRPHAHSAHSSAQTTGNLPQHVQQTDGPLSEGRTPVDRHDSPQVFVEHQENQKIPWQHRDSEKIQVDHHDGHQHSTGGSRRHLQAARPSSQQRSYTGPDSGRSIFQHWLKESQFSPRTLPETQRDQMQTLVQPLTVFTFIPQNANMERSNSPPSTNHFPPKNKRKGFRTRNTDLTPTYIYIRAKSKMPKDKSINHKRKNVSSNVSNNRKMLQDRGIIDPRSKNLPSRVKRMLSTIKDANSRMKHIDSKNKLVPARNEPIDSRSELTDLTKNHTNPRESQAEEDAENEDTVSSNKSTDSQKKRFDNWGNDTDSRDKGSNSKIGRQKRKTAEHLLTSWLNDVDKEVTLVNSKACDMKFTFPEQTSLDSSREADEDNDGDEVDLNQKDLEDNVTDVLSSQPIKDPTEQDEDPEVDEEDEEREISDLKVSHELVSGESERKKREARGSKTGNSTPSTFTTPEANLVQTTEASKCEAKDKDKTKDKAKEKDKTGKAKDDKDSDDNDKDDDDDDDKKGGGKKKGKGSAAKGQKVYDVKATPAQMEHINSATGQLLQALFFRKVAELVAEDRDRTDQEQQDADAKEYYDSFYDYADAFTNVGKAGSLLDFGKVEDMEKNEEEEDRLVTSTEEAGMWVVKTLMSSAFQKGFKNAPGFADPAKASKLDTSPKRAALKVPRRKGRLSKIIPDYIDPDNSGFAEVGTESVASALGQLLIEEHEDKAIDET